MDKFNEYEQRQVKNFILLENRDDTASSEYYRGELLLIFMKIYFRAEKGNSAKDEKTTYSSEEIGPCKVSGERQED